MLFEYKNPAIRELVTHLQETDDELTPEQEHELAQLMAKEEGVFDQVNMILELELDAKRLQETFIEPTQRKIARWKERASQLRSMLSAKLTELLEGCEKRSVSMPGVTVVLMPPRESLDLNAPSLASSKTIEGYTEEEAAASGLPQVYFDQVVTWVPRKDVIRAHLKQKVAVGQARFVLGKPSIQIRIAGQK